MSVESNGDRVAVRTCPLCEATCGLELTLDGDDVVSIRGDREDVFSRGFICPKGVALKELHGDPDRLSRPLVRRADGGFERASWDRAFELIADRLGPILAADRNAVAVYLGNPNAHNLDNMLYGRVLLRALQTRNLYSASTVDQYPKQLASALMFGTGTTVAVPDVDRTDHLVILGANPLASNGSLMTAPDMRGRLRAVRARGGKLVVIDPRRSRTATEADEHHFIRPGTDAHLLFAIAHVLFEDGLADPGGRLESFTAGIEAVRSLSEPFSPEAVAPVCGIDAATIRRIARELAEARTAAVYGRIGTCTQEFGTLASWLVDVVNVLTGNLDRPGGAMFPMAAAGHSNAAGTRTTRARPDQARPDAERAEARAGRGRGFSAGRWQSRVRGLDEVFGELPAACLAEEIETPGDGQVRALITISGNPVLSTPNSRRLDAALAGLEFMVSVDVYLNETTRHADVILPAPSPLRRSHYDLALYQFAVRNVANYSPPVLDADPDIPSEWVTLLRLTGIAAGLGGRGRDIDVAVLDEQVARALLRREVSTPESPAFGRGVDELLGELEPRVGPERLLDLMLRAGPYGDGFGSRSDGPRLSLAALEAAPHGIDLGPLQPRLPDAIRTPSGMIELAPERIVADVERLRASLATREGRGGREPINELVLIGRRLLRSNNSWMHNLPMLVSGKPACTLHVHPDDAERLGLIDGEDARVSSRTGELVATVEVTDAVMPGVVSLPHGWGHDVSGTAQGVASVQPGPNSNVIADELLLDVPSGNAVLNGIPVELAPVRAPVPV